jgi:hypothetical protein
MKPSPDKGEPRRKQDLGKARRKKGVDGVKSKCQGKGKASLRGAMHSRYSITLRGPRSGWDADYKREVRPPVFGPCSFLAARARRLTNGLGKFP